MITLQLTEEELITLLFAASQQSCAFDRRYVEHDLWHLQCCDYNEPLFNLAQKIDTNALTDNDHKTFIENLLKVGNTYFKEDDPEPKGEM